MKISSKLLILLPAFAILAFVWNRFFQIANTAYGPSSLNQVLFIVFVLISGTAFTLIFRKNKQLTKILSFSVLSIVPGFFLGTYRAFAETVYRSPGIEYSVLNPEIYFILVLSAFYSPLFVEIYSSEEEMIAEYSAFLIFLPAAIYLITSFLIPTP